jgi:hypothetical protein
LHLCSKNGLLYLKHRVHYCRDLNLGFATKAKAWKGVSREWNPGVTFALSTMWGNEPTHSQLNSHFESWNPYRVPNFQRSISKVKIHWIKEFFIPLERSSNLNVWNGFTWPTWILKTQVMAKRKVGIQSANLTPTH